MDTLRLRALAQKILDHTNDFCDYYSQKGFPEPTFGVESYPELGLPPPIMAKREAAVMASTELQDLLRGPVGVVRHYMGQVSYDHCLDG